jgi:hypothetical protein
MEMSAMPQPLEVSMLLGLNANLPQFCIYAGVIYHMQATRNLLRKKSMLA